VATECDVLVIGGGFYGCMIACHLRRVWPRVRLLEKGAKLLGRASSANQARVHRGYHYPRSLLTGLRSRVNYARFVRDFAPCVCDTFDAYYAVARHHSKVSAARFELFCQRVGADLRPAPPAVRKLFDPATVEDVYGVTEAAFDADRLRDMMARRMADSGVSVEVNAPVSRVEPARDGRVIVHTPAGTVIAGQVYNCTYSQLNRLRADSGLPPTPLKYELAELALVRVPESLRGLGVTVMCGPFFSVMPYPPAGLHTLSHVRYTPHASWTDDGSAPQQILEQIPRVSNVGRMMLDASRYLPAIAGAVYDRSLWEVKTVLPASEADDGRPILFLTDADVPNFHCVLGAKLDNVFDVLDRIDGLAEPRREVA
jgi:glycine/D-amino acid oxidase-like deaminating enzyme